MKYQLAKFTLPATEPQKKTLCAIHHYDRKGQCLRCPEKIVSSSRGSSVPNGPASRTLAENHRHEPTTEKPEESNGTA
jgi:hypothetical protein